MWKEFPCHDVIMLVTWFMQEWLHFDDILFYFRNGSKHTELNTSNNPQVDDSAPSGLHDSFRQMSCGAEPSARGNGDFHAPVSSSQSRAIPIRIGTSSSRVFNSPVNGSYGYPNNGAASYDRQGSYDGSANAGYVRRRSRDDVLNSNERKGSDEIGGGVYYNRQRSRENANDSPYGYHTEPGNVENYFGTPSLNANGDQVCHYESDSSAPSFYFKTNPISSPQPTSPSPQSKIYPITRESEAYPAPFESVRDSSRGYSPASALSGATSPVVDRSYTPQRPGTGDHLKSPTPSGNEILSRGPGSPMGTPLVPTPPPPAPPLPPLGFSANSGPKKQVIGLTCLLLSV